MRILAGECEDPKPGSPDDEMRPDVEVAVKVAADNADDADSSAPQ